MVAVWEKKKKIKIKFFGLIINTRQLPRIMLTQLTSSSARYKRKLISFSQKNNPA